MSLNIKSLLEAPIIELDTIDSTNNYAMRLIDADMAQIGLTIVANTQTAGKGQRGNIWQDDGSDCILMSIISQPRANLMQQFAFNAGITNAIASVIEEIDERLAVHIKWPNDIIINDKKSAGILIENMIRGHEWLHAIIGIGLNLNNYIDSKKLPFATSLKMELGRDLNKSEILSGLRERILAASAEEMVVNKNIEAYNNYLFGKDKWQEFSHGNEHWEAQIIGVNMDGTLKVRLENGVVENYVHGSVQWVWKA